MHCDNHLADLPLRCGPLIFHYTLINAGFCSFCLGDKVKWPPQQFHQWIKKSNLLNHIDEHFINLWDVIRPECPHPCCNISLPDAVELKAHFEDVHDLVEPPTSITNKTRKRTAVQEGRLEKQTDSEGSAEHISLCGD